MLRIAAAALLLASGPAFSQEAEIGGHHDHAAMSHGVASQARSSVPKEPGQSAFAAIQEIVQILEADPHADWSKVDIEGLRQHLIDMNNVTLDADVTAVPVEAGVQFTVRGRGPVRDSIRRMVSAHAATMNGMDGWKFSAAETEDGASLTVIVPASDLAKVRALGFIGVMTHGMHHQEHHLMLARGGHPHG
ncbi:hypothetical protein [Methylobacterium sp. CM6257]